MKSIFKYAFAVCAIAILIQTTIGIAVADRQNEVSKQTFQALYARMDAALEHKDSKAYLKLCAPEFVSIDLKGTKTNLAQTSQAMDLLVKNAVTIHPSSRVTSIKMNGKHAVVRVAQHAVFKAKNPQSGAIFGFEADEVSDDTWINTQSGWKVTLSKTISSKQRQVQ